MNKWSEAILGRRLKFWRNAELRWWKKKIYKRYWHELSKIRGESDLCIISHVCTTTKFILVIHFRAWTRHPQWPYRKANKRGCSVVPWRSASASLNLESTLLHTHEVPIMQWLILIKRNTSPTWNGRQFLCIFHLGNPYRGKLMWTEDIKHADSKTTSLS